MSLLNQPLDKLSRRALLSGKPADPNADVVVFVLVLVWAKNHFTHH